MDTDRSGDDTRDGLRECTGLISTCKGGVCRHFAGARNKKEEALGGHTVASKRERKHHRKLETL